MPTPRPRKICGDWKDTAHETVDTTDKTSRHILIHHDHGHRGDLIDQGTNGHRGQITQANIAFMAVSPQQREDNEARGCNHVEANAAMKLEDSEGNAETGLIADPPRPGSRSQTNDQRRHHNQRMRARHGRQNEKRAKGPWHKVGVEKHKQIEHGHKCKHGCHTLADWGNSMRPLLLLRPQTQRRGRGGGCKGMQSGIGAHR